jgi:DNA-binding MarR family transcriptional regulator
MLTPQPSVTPSERLASVDDLLLYRLGQFTSAAGAMVVRLCEGGHGITRREWAVLAQLNGQPQGVLPSVLAERMRRDRARTSRTLTALLGKGLIQRMVLPHDRRSVRVSLTPAGQALYDELMPQVQAINARILSVLEPAQKQAFDAALERMRIQAQRLLDEMGPELPKADRRRGGSGRAGRRP